MKGEAVGPGVPARGLYPLGREQGRGEKADQKCQSRRAHRQGRAQTQLGAALLPGEGRQRQHQHQAEERREYLGGGGGEVVVPGHVGGGAQGEQVPRHNGPAPEGVDIAVGQADEPEQPQGDAGGELGAAGDEVEQQGDQVVEGQVEGQIQWGERGKGVQAAEKFHGAKAREGVERKAQPAQPERSLFPQAQPQGDEDEHRQGPPQAHGPGEAAPDHQRGEKGDGGDSRHDETPLPYGDGELVPGGDGGRGRGEQIHTIRSLPLLRYT